MPLFEPTSSHVPAFHAGACPATGTPLPCRTAEKEKTLISQGFCTTLFDH